MRAVMVEVPEGLLEQRRRRGDDRWDEVWDGVLHMVPAPSGGHQRFGLALGAALLAAAESKGLSASYETNLIRPGRGFDDRIPDLVVAREEYATDAGVEGRAELVVEIRSPGDESYDKLGFYAELEVQEVLLVDPGTCAFELFALREGRLHVTAPDDAGCVTLDSLDLTMTPDEGPSLHLTWPGGEAHVPGYPRRGS